MNNQDLRVLKTIENIENVFFELLGSKPIEKITVAELARVARINKGTFYRHYLDIPDLYMKTMQKDGVFAEYYHVNNADANLFLMPDDVSIEDALMTTDMMSTGFHAVENAEVCYGDSVVVFGIGPVGLMAVAGSALLGCGKLYAIGTRPNCAALAKEYGATNIISYKEGDIVQQILDLNHGPVDKVIIAGGNGQSINQALQMVRPNGVISNVNFMDPSDSVNFPAILWGLGMSNVSLRCGFCPGGARRIERLIRMIQAGRVHPGKLLNYKFEGFDKIEDAFKLMDSKPKDLIKPYVLIG